MAQMRCLHVIGRAVAAAAALSSLAGCAPTSPAAAADPTAAARQQAEEARRFGEPEEREQARAENHRIQQQIDAETLAQQQRLLSETRAANTSVDEAHGIHRTRQGGASGPSANK
jgi:hypothetical protein